MHASPRHPGEYSMPVSQAASQAPHGVAYSFGSPSRFTTLVQRSSAAPSAASVAMSPRAMGVSGVPSPPRPTIPQLGVGGMDEKQAVDSANTRANVREILDANRNLHQHIQQHQKQLESHQSVQQQPGENQNHLSPQQQPDQQQQQQPEVVGYSDYPVAPDTKALASGEGHYREVVGSGGESATLMQRQERQLQLLGETVAALRSKLEKERKDHIATKNALSEAESIVRDSKASLAETQRESMKVSLANTEILKASSVFVRQVEDELDQRNQDTKQAIEVRDRVLQKQRQVIRKLEEQLESMRDKHTSEIVSLTQSQAALFAHSHPLAPRSEARQQATAYPLQAQASPVSGTGATPRGSNGIEKLRGEDLEMPTSASRGATGPAQALPSNIPQVPRLNLNSVASAGVTPSALYSPDGRGAPRAGEGEGNAMYLHRQGLVGLQQSSSGILSGSSSNLSSSRGGGRMSPSSRQHSHREISVHAPGVHYISPSRAGGGDMPGSGGMHRAEWMWNTRGSPGHSDGHAPLQSPPLGGSTARSDYIPGGYSYEASPRNSSSNVRANVPNRSLIPQFMAGAPPSPSRGSAQQQHNIYVPGAGARGPATPSGASGGYIAGGTPPTPPAWVKDLIGGAGGGGTPRLNRGVADDDVSGGSKAPPPPAIAAVAATTPTTTTTLSAPTSSPAVSTSNAVGLSTRAPASSPAVSMPSAPAPSHAQLSPMIAAQQQQQQQQQQKQQQQQQQQQQAVAPKSGGGVAIPATTPAAFAAKSSQVDQVQGPTSNAKAQQSPRDFITTPRVELPRVPLPLASPRDRYDARPLFPGYQIVNDPASSLSSSTPRYDPALNLQTSTPRFSASPRHIEQAAEEASDVPVWQRTPPTSESRLQASGQLSARGERRFEAPSGQLSARGERSRFEVSGQLSARGESSVMEVSGQLSARGGGGSGMSRFSSLARRVDTPWSETSTGATPQATPRGERFYGPSGKLATDYPMKEGVPVVKDAKMILMS